MRRFILLISMCVCLSVSAPAQSRFDVGFNFSRTHNGGYLDPELGVTATAFWRTGKLELVPSGTFNFRDHKYNGSGRSASGVATVRYYLGERLFASFTVSGRHLVTDEWSKSWVSVGAGGGFVWPGLGVTLAARYEPPDFTSGNRTSAFRLEGEEACAVGDGGYYVAIRPYFTVNNFDNHPPLTGRMSGERYGMSVSFGKRRR